MLKVAVLVGCLLFSACCLGVGAAAALQEDEIDEAAASNFVDLPHDRDAGQHSGSFAETLLRGSSGMRGGDPLSSMLEGVQVADPVLMALAIDLLQQDGLDRQADVFDAALQQLQNLQQEAQQQQQQLRQQAEALLQGPGTGAVLLLRGMHDGGEAAAAAAAPRPLRLPSVQQLPTRPAELDDAYADYNGWNGCGDGLCSPSESCASCPGDCGPCASNHGSGYSGFDVGGGVRSSDTLFSSILDMLGRSGVLERPGYTSLWDSGLGEGGLDDAALLSAEEPSRGVGSVAGVQSLGWPFLSFGRGYGDGYDSVGSSGDVDDSAGGSNSAGRTNSVGGSNAGGAGSVGSSSSVQPVQPESDQPSGVPSVSGGADGGEAVAAQAWPWLWVTDDELITQMQMTLAVTAICLLAWQLAVSAADALGLWRRRARRLVWVVEDDGRWPASKGGEGGEGGEGGGCQGKVAFSSPGRTKDAQWRAEKLKEAAVEALQRVRAAAAAAGEGRGGVPEVVVVSEVAANKL